MKFNLSVFLLQTGLWCLFVMCLGLDFVRVILYGVHSASSILLISLILGSLKITFSTVLSITFSSHLGTLRKRMLDFCLVPQASEIHFILFSILFVSVHQIWWILLMILNFTDFILCHLHSTIEPMASFVLFSSSIISIFCNFHLFSEIFFCFSLFFSECVTACWNIFMMAVLWSLTEVLNIWFILNCCWCYSIVFFSCSCCDFLALILLMKSQMILLYLGHFGHLFFTVGPINVKSLILAGSSSCLGTAHWSWPTFVGSGSMII